MSYSMHLFNSECPVMNGPVYWTCCTTENPCKEGEGDCDYNYECVGDLVCGTDNCIGAEHPSTGDCCEKPTPSTTTTTTTTTFPEG